MDDNPYRAERVDDHQAATPTPRRVHWLITILAIVFLSSDIGLIVGKAIPEGDWLLALSAVFIIAETNLLATGMRPT